MSELALSEAPNILSLVRGMILESLNGQQRAHDAEPDRPSVGFTHLAIIPDGNRRWGRLNGVTSEEKLYDLGASRLRDILDYLTVRNVPHFSFWGSSLSNLIGRSRLVVETLDKLYARKLSELMDHPLVWEREIKVQVLGAWDQLLRSSTRKVIESITTRTSHHRGMTFNILLAYDGRQERGEAALTMMRQASAGQAPTLETAADADRLLRSFSWTSALPDVDLIIRTGAWEDPHLSADFLTFLSGEAQLVFPQILWPDFTVDELDRALIDYHGRERRFGK